MSYRDSKKSQPEQADEPVSVAERSPGKRTLTMSLAARPVAEDSVQRQSVQRKSGPGSDGATRASAGSAGSASTGQSMPEDVRTRMERAFSADFSAVRVHEGQQAANMDALAYTQGTDIHFAPGQYQPRNQRGQELLGHELTHVVQQAEGRVQARGQAQGQAKSAHGISINDDSALEQEADVAGARAARGQAALGRRAPAVASSGRGPVQRKVAGTSQPTLRMGNRGPHVEELQKALNSIANAALEPDGDFGPATHKAVTAFQGSAGLTPDGIVGSQTWSALEGGSAIPAPAGGQAGAGQTTSEQPSGQSSGQGPAGAGTQGTAASGTGQGAATPAAGTGARPTLRKGSFGQHVKVMQRQLNATGAKLVPDGNFGSGTERALVQFQGGKALPPTGICDDATWTALDAVAPIIAGPAEQEPRDPRVQALITGAFADKGAYKESGDGFMDPELDALLQLYGRFWLIDTRAKAGVESEDKSKGSSSGAGGIDASGSAIKEQPPWVDRLQNRLVEESKWTDDCEASQKLLQAFLNAWTKSLSGGMHSSVEEFYHHVGKSESNNKAKILGGFKGGANWCAQASTFAAIMGLLRKGLRFARGAQPKNFGTEMTKQVNAFVEWQKKGTGATIAGSTAHAAQLEPGDIISLVGHGPLSGHVATVIEHAGDRIRYVSGNAGGVTAGNGTIKAEEVTREQPPAGYNYFKIAAVANASGAANQAKSTISKAEAEKASAQTEEQQQAAEAKRSKAQSDLDAAQATLSNNPDLPVSRDDPRFRPGVHAPAQKGVIWVVTIIKASRLNANVLMAQQSDEALAKEGLERCTPLEQAYPDYRQYL